MPATPESGGPRGGEGMAGQRDHPRLRAATDRGRPEQRLLHRTPRPIFATSDRFLRHQASSDVAGRGPSAPRADSAARADRAQAIISALRGVRIAPIEPELGPLSVADDRNFRKDAMGAQIRSRPVGLGALIGEDRRDGPWP
jgi:hypothetical protein